MEDTVKRRLWMLAVMLPLLFVGSAVAQYPILDMVADKVVQRYQQSTCEQLWQERGKPKTADEQSLVQMLRNDAQMRTAFINKIAAPVANRMFECGMIP
jgi:hypothetical protein